MGFSSFRWESRVQGLGRTFINEQGDGGKE